jgi:hypothetical protein
VIIKIVVKTKDKNRNTIETKIVFLGYIPKIRIIPRNNSNEIITRVNKNEAFKLISSILYMCISKESIVLILNIEDTIK